MNKTIQLMILAIIILLIAVGVIVALTYEPDRSIPQTTELQSAEPSRPSRAIPDDDGE